MSTAEKYIFRYRTMDPAKLRPIGDRYLVEVLPVDEEQLASKLYLPEQTEEQKGWAVGVVFSVGNGHRLENPDPVVVLPEGVEKDKRMEKLDVYGVPAVGEHSSVMRFPAIVPMFFIPGEVIFIERYSGRQFTIAGRQFRFVNQVDCLGTSGVYLRPTEDGLNWIERDLDAERAVAASAQQLHRP